MYEDTDDDDDGDPHDDIYGEHLVVEDNNEDSDDSDNDDDDDDDEEEYHIQHSWHQPAPEPSSEITRILLQQFWPTQEQLAVQANVKHGRWIMNEVGGALESEDLEQTLRRNTVDPDFGCYWMHEEGPDTNTTPHCQPCGPPSTWSPEDALQLSGRIQGSKYDKPLVEKLKKRLSCPSVLGGLTNIVNVGIGKVKRRLAREGLALAFAESEPLLLKTQLAASLCGNQRHCDGLALSTRIKGDGAQAEDAVGVGEGEGEADSKADSEAVEAVQLELSEEDKAIMKGDIKGIDPALLKAQSSNSVIVKKYRQVGELLLEKSSMKIDPKGFKPQKAKELFAGVIADLVYSRVALALDPQISKTIETIKYTPEGQDQALVLPTFMKNLLQNAVDDLLEGQVREQVEKLVLAAIGMAAKLFTKALPGIPGGEDDDDDDDGDKKGSNVEADDKDGEGAADGQDDAEDDDGIGDASRGAAATALATGGVAAALGITIAKGDDPPKILDVLDEDALDMVLYSMVSLRPFVKKYAKTAKKAQSDWFSLSGKDEIKANNRANKKRKKGNRIKVRIPIYQFHKAGLAVATETMIKKVKKKDKEALIKDGVALDVPSDELPALEYRRAVETMMAAWVVAIAKRSCGSDIDKKIKKMKGLDKSEKKQLETEVYQKIVEVLHKETAKMLKDAYDEIGFKLVIPGTKPAKEAGEKSDGDDIGACKQCGKTLRTYGKDHPCYAEFGNLDEWDCDVCGKSFGKEDVLYCCDTFDACDWGACVKCQVLIKPSAIDVESEAEMKKAAKEAKKEAQKAAKKARKKKKSDIEDPDYEENPLADLKRPEKAAKKARKKKKGSKKNVTVEANPLHDDADLDALEAMEIEQVGASDTVSGSFYSTDYPLIGAHSIRTMPTLFTDPFLSVSISRGLSLTQPRINGNVDA